MSNKIWYNLDEYPPNPGGFKIHMAVFSPVIFVRESLDELKKVTWPTKVETIRLTIIVIIVSLIIGLYVGIIDILLAKGLEVITKFR